MSSNGSAVLEEGLVLSARGIGKRYKLYAHPRQRILQSLLGDRKKFNHEF